MAELGFELLGAKDHSESALLVESGRAAAFAMDDILLYGLRASAQNPASLAVVGDAPAPVTPCGGCRQKLREFAAGDCPIWVADLDVVRARFTLGELLPASFGPAHLAP
mgnify:CR=1 FL=1